MTRRVINKFLLFTLLISTPRLLADARIVTYLKLPPQQVLKMVKAGVDEREVINSINNYMTTRPPSKISKKLLQGKLNDNATLKVSGFFATYGGFSDYSNDDGLIFFPLRHTTPRLYLVVTKKIKLAPIKENTISHAEFIIDKNTPADMYLFEKLQDENKQYYWKATKQDIPENRRISAIAMIILTNPLNIYVPLGEFMATESPQMILPNLYVTGTRENDTTILGAMDLLHHLEPVEIESKPVSDIQTQEQLKNQ
jgi:hypothetical protein